MSASKIPGPPYAPQVASVGGIPTVKVDVPICSVFIVMFLAGAISHMAIFQINRRRGHFFLPNVLTFGFCMARIATCIMRIVWATHLTNVRVAIAAMILTTAGVLILFLVNLVFAQRVLRATHPTIGWHRVLNISFLALYILIVLFLAMVITVSVQSLYTLNANTHRIDRDIQLTAATFLMVISFLPIPIVLLSSIIPSKHPLDAFGTGPWFLKPLVVLTAGVLLSLGAAFRTGTNYLNPRPITNPAWYDAKWCFYFFNFVVEILVVYMFLIVRIDRLFFVPKGAKQPGDYQRLQSRKVDEDGRLDEEVVESVDKETRG